MTASADLSVINRNNTRGHGSERHSGGSPYRQQSPAKSHRLQPIGVNPGAMDDTNHRPPNSHSTSIFYVQQRNIRH
ncbi:unnamed protein product [Sordaria macrospora k-hell]|uniref:WGS project CABT00000000 data, contig 2.21 n=1 Tax=Sordaria macrospora (strain ATCC MYA-333 / DSM 997 / K(L3346) / K-hell) TaxID=771870 RepID=F7W223_SORMK|nr:uncharacterized protein SMAC_04655 [Sordaria macrospora k-hell]CCC11673.1 unnamed protein product [Sordaria macrospora k-hell]